MKVEAVPLGAAMPGGCDAAAVARIFERFERLVADGRMPGAVMLLVRGGKTALFEAVGRLDPAQPAPMPRDAIFRIYSMTKPVVSVAALQLFERGRLRLDDPVARYLPEFATTQVGVERGGRLERIPPGRPMTVHDLLRHTAGLSYEFLPPSPVVQAYIDANLRSPTRSNAELSRTLADLPLAHSPGTVWEYSRATDVLGRLVEVVAGRTLGEQLKATVFDPLGMVDTGFRVPAAQQHRIAEPHPADPDTGAAVRLGDPRRAIALELGGGGLVSTASDYGRFLQMLLDGGRLDGARLLGRKTVELMTADHLGAIPTASGLLPPGYGFGLGVAVRLVAGLASDPGSVGSYGWSGASGTMFFVDPAERMFGVMLAQAPGQAGELRELYRNMACAAID